MTPFLASWRVCHRSTSMATRQPLPPEVGDGPGAGRGGRSSEEGGGGDGEGGGEKWPRCLDVASTALLMSPGR